MPIPTLLVIDSVMSFSALEGTRKPLNLWYVGVAGILFILGIDAFVLRTFRARLSKLWLAVLYSLGVLTWITTIILGNVGYFWVQQSWGPQPEGLMELPTRYKFLFTGLLFLLVFAYSPLVIIPGMVIHKFFKYAQKKYKNFKLKKYYSLIYNSKFDIKSILPKLDADFFAEPMSKPELKHIKKNFTQKLPKAHKFEDICPICYIEYSKNDLHTEIPGCCHGFHFKCLKVWLTQNHICPVCRAEVRKNMIEHYHGPFHL